MLPLDGETCDCSHHYLILAIGESGMDKTRYEKCDNGKDFKMFLSGKVSLDVLEGELYIEGTEAMPEVHILDLYGKRLLQITGRKAEGGMWQYGLSGKAPSACLEVRIPDEMG